MTRRKQPKNKTIAKAAFKSLTLVEADMLDNYINKYGNVSLKIHPLFAAFVFPNDPDKIQPDQINGNLTIKFPE